MIELIDSLGHLAMFLIPPLFLIYATQVAWFARAFHLDKQAKRAMTFLLAVFVWSSIAGYLSEVLQFSEFWKRVTHIPLLVATVGLVLSQNARILARSLREDRDGSR